jgi:hypothetical protein
LRAERKGREGRELGRLEKKGERRGRREEKKVFFFLKLFSKSFFKLSNFNQTEIHAFES